MNKPGSFKRAFEPMRFFRMVGLAAGLAFIAAKAVVMFIPRIV